jgi:hypothetical protein
MLLYSWLNVYKVVPAGDPHLDNSSHEHVTEFKNGNVVKYSIIDKTWARLCNITYASPHYKNKPG